MCCKDNYLPTFSDASSWAAARLEVPPDLGDTGSDGSSLNGGGTVVEFPWWMVLLVLLGIAAIARHFA